MGGTSNIKRRYENMRLNEAVPTIPRARAERGAGGARGAVGLQGKSSGQVRGPKGDGPPSRISKHKQLNDENPDKGARGAP